MAVEFGIWRIDGESTSPVATSALENEARLEAILEQDPFILGLDALLIIGRQVTTSFGTRIDLLAIDSQGMLYVIEVKKGRTPRDVVAQAFDYGYWVRNLSIEEVGALYEQHHDGQPFDQAFRGSFDTSPPDELTGEHQLIIVASTLDPATDRIVQYVRDQGVPVFVVFFQYFRDGDQEFLARTWDADPSSEAVTRPMIKKPAQPWNGQDFYVCLGEDRRSWDDALKYGFVSGGGGKRWSGPLQGLFSGARVFLYIPQKDGVGGYVGAGIVKESTQRVKDFMVDIDGRQIPILQAPLKQPRLAEDVDDEEKSEYLVRVDWIKTVPRDEAIWEKGMFANQNTVVRLRDQFTLEKLTDAFGLDHESS